MCIAFQPRTTSGMLTETEAQVVRYKPLKRYGKVDILFCNIPPSLVGFIITLWNLASEANLSTQTTTPVSCLNFRIRQTNAIWSNFYFNLIFINYVYVCWHWIIWDQDKTRWGWSRAQLRLIQLDSHLGFGGHLWFWISIRPDLEVCIQILTQINWKMAEIFGFEEGQTAILDLAAILDSAILDSGYPLGLT